MSKYDAAFKLKVVQRFLSEGGGHKRLAKEYGIPEEKIRTWTSPVFVNNDVRFLHAA